MTPTLPLSNAPANTPVAAIVVAAGKGLRAGGTVPKQFALWHGKPLVRHSVESLISAGIAPIVVAIPQGWETVAAAALQELPGIVFVHGGATRRNRSRWRWKHWPRMPRARADPRCRPPILPRAVIEGWWLRWKPRRAQSRCCRWWTAWCAAAMACAGPRWARWPLSRADPAGL
jgi:2-C-methyl-D-erythritol 4-phosphate cytidylyltransferase/2-C-methyl-D-erythritol 2,4-cyclodiphosphate synthase